MSINVEKIKQSDYIIVGSGFTGSVMARRLAEEMNQKVHIIERRKHIAGNMFDERNDAGVLVQRYGIHVIHTDEETVIQYLERFSDLRPYKVFCLGQIEDKLLPVPFNFLSINLLYPPKKAATLKAALLNAFPGRESAPIAELLESNEPNIKQYAQYLYQHDFLPYTAKQWGVLPQELDPAVIARVPVVLSEQCDYFSKKYQYMPSDGFTTMFQNMLNHPNITYDLECDIHDYVGFEDDCVVLHTDGEKIVKPLIYTGPLDELFAYQHGKLPYRSLRFEYETLQKEKYQTAPFVVYPEEVDYTRIVEFKHFTGENPEKCTTIMKEYPVAYTNDASQSLEPYYPIPNETNEKQHQRYVDMSAKYTNLVIGGRLADYRYYYMYEAVLRAFELYENIRKGTHEQ